MMGDGAAYMVPNDELIQQALNGSVSVTSIIELLHDNAVISNQSIASSITTTVTVRSSPQSPVPGDSVSSAFVDEKQFPTLQASANVPASSHQQNPHHHVPIKKKSKRRVALTTVPSEVTTVSSSPNVREKQIKYDISTPLNKFGNSLVASPIFSSAKKDVSNDVELQLLSENLHKSLKHKEKLDILAELYGKLMLNNFVPSFNQEIQFLIVLLSVVDQNITKMNQEITPIRLTYAADEIEDEKLLGKVSNCNYFASKVLCRILPIVLAYGSKVCQMLLRYKAVMIFCKDIIGELRYAANLSTSVQNHEIILRYSLPFREETDSRHHFSSKELGLLYQNREKVRDFFLDCLRQHHKQQLESLSSTVAINERCQQCLSMLISSNLIWFANLFVLEMLQVCSASKELDSDVTHLTKDATKLGKLHRRMSAQPINVSQTASYGKKKRFSKRPAFHPTPDTSQASTAHMSHHINDIFFNDEVFFYTFLIVTNSYAFNQNVLLVLMLHFNKFMQMEDSALTTDNLAQRIIGLRLVGKFLGYLMFSPYYSTSDSSYKSESLAFQIALKDSIFAIDLIGSPTIDINQLMLDALHSNTLYIIIPFITNYLKLINLDNVNRNSTYYNRSFSLLRSFHAMLKLVQQGSNSTDSIISNTMKMFILTEIEQLFQYLNLKLVPDLDKHLLEVCEPKFYHIAFLDTHFLEIICNELEIIRGFIAKNNSNSNQIRKLKLKLEPTTDLSNQHSSPPAALFDSDSALNELFQQRLSDAFLHLHPELKKVVGIVAEAVTSNVLNQALSEIKLDSSIKAIFRSASFAADELVKNEKFVKSVKHKASLLVVSKTEHTMQQPIDSMIRAFMYNHKPALVASCISVTKLLVQKKIHCVLSSKLHSKVMQSISDFQIECNDGQHISDKADDVAIVTVETPLKVSPNIDSSLGFIDLLLTFQNSMHRNEANLRAINEQVMNQLPVFRQLMLDMTEADLSAAQEQVERLVESLLGACGGQAPHESVTFLQLVAYSQCLLQRGAQRRAELLSSYARRCDGENCRLVAPCMFACLCCSSQSVRTEGEMLGWIEEVYYALQGTLRGLDVALASELSGRLLALMEDGTPFCKELTMPPECANLVVSNLVAFTDKCSDEVLVFESWSFSVI